MQATVHSIGVNDVIQCDSCGRISYIHSLFEVPGQKITRADKIGAPFETKYYYCSCDGILARVYDPGDGSGFRLNKAKLA